MPVLWRNESGATAAEFAIVLPVLVALFAGMGQLAWAQHCTSSLRYALSTAGRAIMLNPAMTQTQLQTLVKSKLAAADPNVTVTLTISNGGSGQIATIRGDWSSNVIIPLMTSTPLNYTATVKTALPSV